MHIRIYYNIIFPIVILFTCQTSAQNTEYGPIRTSSTIHSIGLEWDITGDDNHNATCNLKFRKKTALEWRPSIPLFRVDFHGYYNENRADRGYNMFAGSVMFLEPGSEYELRLQIRDPDGGDKDTMIEIRTKQIPSMPLTGRTLYVEPGNGTGNGSLENPYNNLYEAQAGANPGDIVLLEPGEYGAFRFNKSGTSDAFIVWKASDDGSVIFDFITIDGHHIWFDGLQIRATENSLEPGGSSLGFSDNSSSPSINITNCAFTNFNIAIQAKYEGSNGWYIADNTIIGNKERIAESDITGEGIQLINTTGHNVCFNSISMTGDGISCIRCRDSDIFNNDIFNVTDDGIEPDYSYANIRIWRNRITNPVNAAFSFQPMYCGPWYFVRNQVMSVSAYIFKYRVVDRFFLAHNTFWGKHQLGRLDQNILSAFSRNNLWILEGEDQRIWSGLPCTDSETGCTMPEHFSPDWQTDVDFDGFDWGNHQKPFIWGTSYQEYSNLEEFSKKVKIEMNGISIKKEFIFENLNNTNKTGRYKRCYLTLKSGSNAIDSGDVLPGINQNYNGKCPDLGAYELKDPLPVYGPRTKKNSDKEDHEFYAFPNPFSKSIRLRAITSKEVVWTIQDSTGRIIRNYKDQDWVWNAVDHTTGIYVVNAIIEGRCHSKQVILMK